MAEVMGRSHAPGYKECQFMIYPPPSPSCQIPHLNDFYQKYFGDLSHGTFVEVGGNDGYSWSNTWHLGRNGLERAVL